jgi:hypothetical protein
MHPLAREIRKLLPKLEGRSGPEEATAAAAKLKRLASIGEKDHTILGLIGALEGRQGPEAAERAREKLTRHIGESVRTGDVTKFVDRMLTEASPSAWREVERDAFFQHINPLDVSPSVKGNYPYTSLYQTGRGDVHGKTRDYHPPGSGLTARKYFLPNSEVTDFGGEGWKEVSQKEFFDTLPVRVVDKPTEEDQDTIMWSSPDGQVLGKSLRYLPTGEGHWKQRYYLPAGSAQAS